MNPDSMTNTIAFQKNLIASFISERKAIVDAVCATMQLCNTVFIKL